MVMKFKLVRPSEYKVLDEEAGRIEVVVSDESVDRDGDVIRQSHWDFEDFMKHPVLVASHDYRRLSAQIGEWEDVEVRGQRTYGKPKYYVGAGNPEADWGFALAMRGKAAYSVGFIPDMEKAKPMKPKNASGNFEFLGQRLLEISQVVVPANPNALQLMQRSKGLHPEIDDIVDELLEETDTETLEQPVHSVATIEQLAQTLSEILQATSGIEARLVTLEYLITVTKTEEPPVVEEQLIGDLGKGYRNGARDAIKEMLSHAIR